jgi:hypothetical protein
MNTNTVVRSLIVTLALGAALLFGAHTAANAQYTFFPNNATINYALPHSSDVAVVGEKNDTDWNNGTGFTSPTVNIIAGASIAGGAYVLDDSIVNMSGGFCQGFLASDSTTVNITGGTIVNAYTFWYATLNVYAGATVTGVLAAQYGGTVNVYGGSIGSTGTDAFAQGTGNTLNIYGGTFVSQQIWVDQGAALTISGGTGYRIIGYTYFKGVRTPIFGLVRYVVTRTLVSSDTTLTYNGSTTGGWTEYQLSGQLGDGTNVDGVKVFVANDGSSFKVYNPFLY